MTSTISIRPASGILPVRMPPFRKPDKPILTQTKDCGQYPAEKEITMKKNNKVYICSPFRPVGETVEERAKSIKAHKILARYACRYAVAKGYSPLCPHLTTRSSSMTTWRMNGRSECCSAWLV